MAALPLPWQRLRGACVVITGASGTVGGMLVAALDAAQRAHDLDLRLVGTYRHRPGLPEHLPPLGDTPLQWVRWDLQQQAPPELSQAVPGADGVWVFHCAATTSSSTMASQPLQVFEGILTGTSQVLGWAQQQHATRVVYLSSVEVYGLRSAHPRVADEEAYLGEIDPVDPRSCYPLGKRAAEHLCTLYATQHGLNCVVARLGQVVGMGTSALDPRAPAAFTRQVLLGQDVILRSTGTAMGNYCDSLDALAGLLQVGLVGHSPTAYTVVNPASSMQVAQLAQLICDRFGGGRCQVRIDVRDRRITGFAAPTANRLSADRLRHLGWHPRTQLADSLSQMVQYWHASGQICPAAPIVRLDQAPAVIS